MSMGGVAAAILIDSGVSTNLIEKKTVVKVKTRQV